MKRFFPLVLLVVVLVIFGISILVFRYSPDMWVFVITCWVLGLFAMVHTQSIVIDTHTAAFDWLRLQRSAALRGDVIIDNVSLSSLASHWLMPEHYISNWCAGREVFFTPLNEHLNLGIELKTGEYKTYTLSELKLVPGSILRISPVSEKRRDMYASPNYAYLPEPCLEIRVIP